MKTWIAEAIDVPGDGTCMFHAIALPLKVSGHYLRNVVSSHIEKYPDSNLHGETLRNWILWDRGISPESYAQKLRQGQWGGSLETTLLASMLNTPIFVYQPKDEMCTRISESRPDISIQSIQHFQLQHLQKAPKFLCLLYVGRNHYMSLNAAAVSSS